MSACGSAISNGRSGFIPPWAYVVVGTVEGTAFGSLTMLRLPDDDFVTIELVHAVGLR
jgi:lactoylglutathione lyase